MNFSGYVKGGRFAADALRLGMSTTRLETATMPPHDFLARLPAEAKSTLEHMVEMLRAGTFPSIYIFGVSKDSWGFDFKAHEIEVLDSNFEGDLSGEVFSMSMDGGGNHNCLQADGKVVIWNHEESNIEDHTQFPSLDEALCALLLREAVSDDVSHWDEVKALFEEKAADGESGWSYLKEQIDEQLEDG